MKAKLTKPYEVAPGKIKPIGTELIVDKELFNWLLNNGYLSVKKKRGKIQDKGVKLEKKVNKIKVETKKVK